MAGATSSGPGRAEVLETLPVMLGVLRRLVILAFEAGDPEGDELRRLLDACVVGAHRLKLREQLRDGLAEGGT